VVEGLAGGTPSPLRAHHGRPPDPRAAPIAGSAAPSPRLANHGPPPNPRASPITDHRPIPTPRQSRTAARSPRRAHHGLPPDPHAAPITDHRPIPTPRQSRTAARSPRRAHHGPLPRPRAAPITDHRPTAPAAHHGPPPRPNRRERGLICGNSLARARFRKISPLHGLISTDPASRARFREISPPMASRAPEHAASRTARASEARCQRPRTVGKRGSPRIKGLSRFGPARGPSRASRPLR
jgi:hypothetical protein